MKIISLDPVITFEDIIRITDHIAVSKEQLIVTPAFSWLKKSLQDISVSLFHGEQEEARKQTDALQTRCIDFARILISDSKSYDYAADHIMMQFIDIRNIVCGMLSLMDDKKLSACGEYISSILIVGYLMQKGYDARLISSAEIMQMNSKNLPDHDIITQHAHVVKSLMDENKIFVAQSGLSKNAYGEIEYIPRCNADTYAVYMAIAFNADELMLWYSPERMFMNGNNRYYNYTSQEAESFINSGIPLVSEPCLKKAREHGIDIVLTGDKTIQNNTIHIHNRLDPHENDSMYGEEGNNKGNEAPQKKTNCIKAISVKRNVSYIRMHSSATVTQCQFMEKSMGIFTKYKIPIYLSAASCTKISLAARISDDSFALIKRELNPIAEALMETNISVISLIGDFGNDCSIPETELMNLLRDIPVLMICYGSDECNISIAVRETDREAAIRNLLSKYIPEKNDMAINDYCSYILC